MRGTIQFVLIIFLAFGLSSCDQGSGGSDDSESTFRLKLTSGTSKVGKNSVMDFAMTDLGGTTFNITEARTNVRHIQFDFPEGNSNTSNQISLDGPFLIDLITGVSNPVINRFEIEPGTYRRIDVRLDDTKASDGLVSAGDDLLDNTLVVKGNFDYDGVSDRNFSIVLGFNEDVRFSWPAGIVIQEGATQDIALSLKVDEWLSTLNLTECLDQGDLDLNAAGDLIISDDVSNDCGNIEGVIKSNIKNRYDIDF